MCEGSGLSVGSSPLVSMIKKFKKVVELCRWPRRHRRRTSCINLEVGNSGAGSKSTAWLMSGLSLERVFVRRQCCCCWCCCYRDSAHDSIHDVIAASHRPPSHLLAVCLAGGSVPSPVSGVQSLSDGRRGGKPSTRHAAWRKEWRWWWWWWRWRWWWCGEVVMAHRDRRTVADIRLGTHCGPLCTDNITLPHFLSFITWNYIHISHTSDVNQIWCATFDQYLAFLRKWYTIRP